LNTFLRGKFIALSAYKKNPDRAQTSSLTTYLKALEQKEANSSKRSRQQEKNQTWGRNQPSGNKKKYSKNQPNEELVL
jgi:thiamine biosynthesis lipoprotein ApbE